MKTVEYGVSSREKAADTSGVNAVVASGEGASCC